jgi:short-subunit dehydrogenase
VSSVDGIVSLPGNAPYDSAKFALEAFADAVRVELSFWDVSVAVINPSTMRTPLAMRFFEDHRTSWEQMNAENPQGEWKKHFTPSWLDAYVEQGKKQLETIAQDPKHAVNDILHALRAKHPKMRYLSGTTAKTLFFALWKMPEEWAFAVKKVLVYPPPENTVKSGPQTKNPSEIN